MRKSSRKEKIQWTKYHYRHLPSLLPATKAKAYLPAQFSPIFTTLKMYRFFLLVEKVKMSIYIIITWWKEKQHNTWEFELTAKLELRKGHQELQCNLSDQKRGGENPLHPVLLEALHVEFSSPCHILRGTLINLFQWWISARPSCKKN